MPFASRRFWMACAAACLVQVSVAARQRDSTKTPPVDFSAYGFPGLLKALYTDDFKRINDEPRVRAYYVGMSKAFTETCGEPPASETSYMMQYGFPETREMRRNPAAGLKDALERLMGRPDRGTGYTGPRVASEGYEDARLFTRQFDCKATAFLRMRGNLFALFQRNYQSGPDGLLDDARLIPLTSVTHRRKNGIPDPPPPPVHWWTPLLGVWRGTIEEARGTRPLTMELVDFVDPSLRGVLSEVVIEYRDPPGDPMSISRSPVIRLTSEKNGLVEFPGSKKTDADRIEAAISADGQRITGVFIRDVPNPANQKSAITLTKQPR